MEAENRKHYLYIDIIRILSLFLIIVYHYMIEAELVGTYYFTYRGIPYATPNLHIAMVGVALFFMISGGGLMLGSQKDFSAVRYYKKRIRRIMIPFYLTYLAVFILTFIGRQESPFAGKEIPPWRVVLTLAGMDEYLSSFGVQTFTLGIGEWFLGCLILLYLAFPLVRLCVLKKPVLTFIAVTVCYVVFVLNYPLPYPVHTCLLIKFYDFFLGMYMVRWQKYIKKPVLLLTLPVILVWLLWPVELPIPSAFSNNIISAVLFLTLMQGEELFQAIVKPNGLLAKLCSISYEIFLVHHFVIYHFDDFYEGIELPLWQALLIFPAELLVIILAALLLKKAEQLTCSALDKLNKRL